MKSRISEICVKRICINQGVFDDIFSIHEFSFQKRFQPIVLTRWIGTRNTVIGRVIHGWTIIITQSLSDWSPGCQNQIIFSQD